MIPYQSAIEAISTLTKIRGVSSVPLAKATGRILGRPLLATIPSPPFTNSAMDGYACRYEDAIQGNLLVVGSLQAGMTPNHLDSPASGSAVRITTGAPLPEWADTVIPYESVEFNGSDLIKVKGSVCRGDFIRPQGHDIPMGSSLLGSGTLLDAERIMVAAAFGYDSVPVIDVPRIVLATSGDEVVPPGIVLAPGKVFNSARYFLESKVQGLGWNQPQILHLEDDLDWSLRRIGPLINDDAPTLLLTSGAVSAGHIDFIPQLARDLGFEILFHKVAVRPGKPVMLAKRGHQVWLGLPGNPLAACTGWYYFARPVLEAMTGLTGPAKRWVQIVADIDKPTALRCFYRGELAWDYVTIGGRQGSGEFASSINSNCYVELPEGESLVTAGTKVLAITL
jgi:molybdopterin molybdotransferase